MTAQRGQNNLFIYDRNRPTVSCQGDFVTDQSGHHRHHLLNPEFPTRVHMEMLQLLLPFLVCYLVSLIPAIDCPLWLALTGTEQSYFFKSLTHNEFV
jgi:hypothetical protein